MFGLTKKEVYNEELHEFFSSPHIFWAVTSREMRWTGNVARIRYIHDFGGET